MLLCHYCSNILSLFSLHYDFVLVIAKKKKKLSPALILCRIKDLNNMCIFDFKSLTPILASYKFIVNLSIYSYKIG